MTRLRAWWRGQDAVDRALILMWSAGWLGGFIIGVFVGTVVAS